MLISHLWGHFNSSWGDTLTLQKESFELYLGVENNFILGSILLPHFTPILEL